MMRDETTYMEWLAGLNAGDTVALAKNYGRSHALRKVERLTATQIVLDRDDRFRRSDGHRVGNFMQYGGNRLLQPTPEILASVGRGRALNEIAGVKWQDLSTETLEAVLAAVKADRQPATPL